MGGINASFQVPAQRIEYEDVVEQKQRMQTRLRAFKEELTSIRILNHGRDEILELGIEELKSEMRDLNRNFNRMIKDVYENDADRDAARHSGSPRKSRQTQRRPSDE